MFGMRLDETDSIAGCFGILLEEAFLAWGGRTGVAPAGRQPEQKLRLSATTAFPWRNSSSRSSFPHLSQ
jgi:hypothetical protein